MARKRRDPGDTPIAEKILDAASRLFVTVGYENTSMKSIAAEAEITPGALYYHYANKQDIVYQTLERAVLGLAEHCEQAIAKADDDVAALRAFVRSHILYQLTNLNNVAAVYTALVYGMRHQPVVLSQPQLDRLRSIEVRHLDTLRRILRRGVVAGTFVDKSPTLASFAIIGMCEHVANWHHAEGAMSAESIAAFFADQAEIIAREALHSVAVQRPRGPRASPAGHRI